MTAEEADQFLSPIKIYLLGIPTTKVDLKLKVQKVEKKLVPGDDVRTYNIVKRKYIIRVKS